MNLVTALVPSDTACLANSPGNSNLTAVYTSLDDKVLLLLNLTNLEASKANLSNESFTNEFMIYIAFFEIPTSEWTCFNTL